MKSVPLGRTSIHVSEVGLGTSKLASFSSALSRKESLRVLHAAADLGITFFDTADSYGQGEAEELLGLFCREKRDKFILASKAGFRFRHTRGALRILKPLARMLLKQLKAGKQLVATVRSRASAFSLLDQSFEPAYIDAAIESSLRRLCTCYLDVFFLHEPPASALTPALSELLRQRKDAGQIRAFGISTGHAEVLEVARNFQGLEIIQAPVNRLTMPVLGPSLKGCADRGFGIVANQVFDSGRLLAGGESRESLLRFATGVPGVSTIIVGTTSPAHLQENTSMFERCS